MSFNAELLNTILCSTFTLDTGVARVWTFQAPTFPTQIVAFQYAADACDATDNPIAVLSVNGDTRMTGVAQTSADTVQKITTADTGKSLVVAADAKIQITLTYGGTAANVRGLVVQLFLKAYLP